MAFLLERTLEFKLIVDHIHITVCNLKEAEKFYDNLLPYLGYDLNLKEYTKIPEHEYESIEYHHKIISIGLINSRSQFSNEQIHRRRPGSLHHLAFFAESNDEVDYLYDKIKSVGAQIVSSPRFYPEYCPDYYAFFFKDPEGIKFEIVYYDKSRYFE
ncbi:VOC family protein [Koleobacter methoxysyntrophicus]|uniref:VOC family protein n=1 Tax=Koleobacter methoxysyntrophicus TaxID=2751313 RepID=UPI001F50CAEC|nr:VOC family protein [Koleobacter methoxysyntrophicus]